MKKISIMLLLLVAISTLFIVGCSDDDEQTIIAAATTQGWILGQAYVNPEIRFYADIFPMSNTFAIDSIKAGDSLCTNENDDYWYVYSNNDYHYTEYENDDDTLRYSSGDMCNVTFYKNNSSTTTSIKLLHRTDDEPVFVTPTDDNDTVSTGSTVEFVWNSVPNADWYGLYYRYYQDSSGTYINPREYFSITDTTFTVSGATTTNDGYVRLYVVAVTGPRPGDAPNINGLGLKGDLHSETYSESRRVYIGTGDPTPVGSQDEEEIVDPQTIGKRIIKEVRTQPVKQEKPTNNF